MAETLTFDILARDRASRTFERVAKSTEAMETRFTRMTHAATGLATALVGAQVGKSVLEAADKFELSRSRLETITQNIGANFDDLSKQVTAADAHMAALGFTAADAEGALASLEAVTRNPTKALKDLALAADIARGRNISLEESVRILQRIETGHVSMLARLGIATKDAAGHTLTQAQALEMLARLYGGSASRYADTFAGKQKALAAEMQNSAAQIGVALLPAAVDLAKVIQQDVLPPIVSTAQWFDRNKRVIEPLAKALLIAVAAWKAYAIWTRAAAAANVLFGRSAAVAATGAATSAVAARGAAGAGAAGAAGGAAIRAGQIPGTPITGLTNLATSALTAARNIGVMGLATLGFANFISNPRSLGFPFGFNRERSPGAVHPGQSIRLPNGQTTQVTGSQTVYYDKAGHPFSDADLKHPIEQTNQLTAATNKLTASERALGSATQRTAAQIEASAQHALALRSAQDGLRQAIHEAAQTAADSGRALRGNSDAALANRDAIRNEVGAIFSVIDAMKARNASADLQRQMLATLTGALEANAIKTYGDKAAVDALLTSLGLIPGAASNAASALSSYMTAQISVDAALDPKRLEALRAQDAKTKAAAKQIAKSFTTGFTPVVAKATQDAADAAARAFQKMKDRMISDIQTLKDSVRSLTSSLVSFADIANNTGGTDTLGAQGGPANILAFKRQKAAELEQFARLYGRLRKAGLNPEDLREFFAAGPAAIPAMRELLNAGRAGIRQENALTQRIQTAAGQVARQEAGLENLALLHRDFVQLPAKLKPVFANAVKQLHIYTDVQAVDRAIGKKIVTG